MIKRIYIFFAGSMLFCMVCCEPGATDTTQQVNPNGDSELAVLMRNMYSYQKNTRNLILNKKDFLSYPAGFNNIKTAKPTDDNTKDELYNPMADAYLSAIKELDKGSNKDKIRKYNQVVAACDNCHHHYCPGPLQKINALYIEEK